MPMLIMIIAVIVMMIVAGVVAPVAIARAITVTRAIVGTVVVAPVIPAAGVTAAAGIAPFRVRHLGAAAQTEAAKAQGHTDGQAKCWETIHRDRVCEAAVV
jgi:hypothetical protein